MKASVAAWHDVECGSYAADLPLWRQLAVATGGSVLDLGCGTGRVALDLAEHGHRVTALDSDAELVHELTQRARARNLRVETVTADARTFALAGAEFPLAIAPMQVAQLLGGADGRAAMMERVRAHLSPAGLLAVALADPFEAVAAEDALPPLPDVREEEGWLLSSRPLTVRAEPSGVAIDRLRQIVSPSGELIEEMVTIVLDGVTPQELEAEAGAAGLRAAGRRAVPETPDHVGSTVVLLERPA